jgi:CubicO group peptidase (beta-lactamase class C family)
MNDDAKLDEGTLEEVIVGVLNRWPSAGVAIAVVRDSGPVWFHTQGVANTRSLAPITQGTVFRIGSLTKTFTAVAVMQLWEQGLVDLDAPVTRYLRAFRLVPTKPGLGPVTLRHLLTHTAGIGYWLRASDLLRPRLGSGVETGHPVGSLAQLYRRGVPFEVEPGTKWMYSNHGFAVLGQVVEDVSGEPFDRYLRGRVFDVLGLEHTDLVLSERVRPALAEGYVLRRNGLKAVPHREVPTPGGGGIYSTVGDVARYTSALLAGGSNDAGVVLKPATVAAMFSPHFQPDARIPGEGLGFDLAEESGHRMVGKDGVVSGFLSAMSLAPDDGVGVVVLSNTGGLDAVGAPVPLGDAILRHLLRVPLSPVRANLPPHPEVWADLCGWYGLTPGPMTNVFMRLVIGAGVEVRVRKGQLVLKPLNPLPALRRGMRLHPSDPGDPYAFRVDLSDVGKPPIPVVFSRAAGGVDHLCFGETVLRKRTPRKESPR